MDEKFEEHNKGWTFEVFTLSWHIKGTKVFESDRSFLLL